MTAKRVFSSIGVLFLIFLVAPGARSSTGSEVQNRIDDDVAAGRPIVVHVVVALCDNANQGIVPVRRALGDGQNPRTNLYWGALYGLRTHFERTAGWTRIRSAKPEDRRILERVVLFAEVKRGGAEIPIYVVADAWDGAHIREAIGAYLRLASGQDPENVELTNGSSRLTVGAGGSAHLLAYVGHNGLMEFSLDSPVPERPGSVARSAAVLACASKPYFQEHLQVAGAHPLLLTTGLMAPEAYTLDSAIRAWVDGGTTSRVGDAAGRAYDSYQKCGARAARRLFWGAP